jgi:capsular polysaccharide biosynthesis protein
MRRSIGASIRCALFVGLLASQLMLTALAGGPPVNPFEDSPAPDSKAASDSLATKTSSEIQPTTEHITVPRSETSRLHYKLEVDALESLMRSRSDTQKQISDLKFKIKLAELLAKNAENNNVPEEDIEAEITKDPRIQQAMLELSGLERNRRELEIAAKDQANDSEITRNKEAIQSVRKSFEEIKSEDRQQVINSILRDRETAAKNRRALELERSLLIAQLKETIAQIEIQAENVQKLEIFKGDAEELRNQIEQEKGIIREMSTTLTKWNMEIDAPPRVRVLESAGKSEAVLPARQWIGAGVAGFVGFLLALLGIVFVRLIRRKRNVSQQALAPMSVEANEALPTIRRRKWRPAFVSALLFGVASGALGWYLLPTKYESSAWLRVRATIPSIWHGENGADFESYRQNQISMIKGNLVINRALDEKSVQDSPIIRRHSSDPTNWLSDNLVAEFPGNGEIMQVSLRYEDPNGVSDIVNAVVTAFVKEVVVRERDDKLIRRDNLDKKLRSYKQQVLDKQRQLFELSQQIGTADAPTTRVRYKLEVDTLETFMRQRSETQTKIADLTFKIKLAELLTKNAENNKVPEEEIEAAVSKDPRIQQAIIELSSLERKRRELEIAPKDQATDSTIARLKDTINGLRRNVDEIKSEDRQQVINSVRRQDAISNTNLQSLQLEKALLIDEYKTTLAQIEKQAENVHKLQRFNGDEDQLRAEIEQAQAIINDMRNELARRNIELDASPRVSVIDSAGKAVPVRPALQWIGTVVAGFVGFVVALLGIIFIRFIWRGLTAFPEPLAGSSVDGNEVRPAARWRKTGLAFASALLVGGACGALGWYLLPTQYESSAWLQVQANRPSIWQGENEPDFESYRRFQLAMIKGTLVINKALDSKSVSESPIMGIHKADPSNWLAENLAVDIPGNGEMVKISLRSEDPDGVSDLVTAVVAAYMKEVVDKERTEKLVCRDNLERKLRTLKQQLLDRNRQLYELAD